MPPVPHLLDSGTLVGYYFIQYTVVLIRQDPDQPLGLSYLWLALRRLTQSVQARRDGAHILHQVSYSGSGISLHCLCIAPWGRWPKLMVYLAVVMVQFWWMSQD